jgi:hypothetical protein
MLFEAVFDVGCSEEGVAVIGEQVALLKDKIVGRGADSACRWLRHSQGDAS